MKWLAVFTAMIGNQPANIDDLDGPTEFATEQACIDHIRDAAPKLNAILQKYTANLDIMLLGECLPIGGED